MRAPPEMRKPALAGTGSLEISSASRLNYSTNSPKRFDTQDVAVAIVARRYCLSPCIARLVCELASIGGRLS